MESGEREEKKKGLKKHRWKKLGHERELIFQTNVTDRSNLHLTGNTGVNFDGLSPLVSIPPLHPRAIFHASPRNVTLIFSCSCYPEDSPVKRIFFIIGLRVACVYGWKRICVYYTSWKYLYQLRENDKDFLMQSN